MTKMRPILADSEQCSPYRPGRGWDPSIRSFDMPQLPATVLIDDIEEVVIRLENVRIDPAYYSYSVSLYPPSHHMR